VSPFAKYAVITARNEAREITFVAVCKLVTEPISTRIDIVPVPAIDWAPQLQASPNDKARGQIDGRSDPREESLFHHNCHTKHSTTNTKSG
jgi:hypothetical protein